MIFLDLDGVMADLEGHYLHNFGHTMDKAPSRREMWANVHNYHEFFYNMPPVKGAIDFYGKIRHLRPVVLTSCPASRYGVVANEKKRWVQELLDAEMLVIPCCGSETKQWFIQNKGDILIDDYGQNCREWEAAGGIAIKHEGEDFDTTYRAVIRATGGSEAV